MSAAPSSMCTWSTATRGASYEIIEHFWVSMYVCVYVCADMSNLISLDNIDPKVR